MTDEENEDLVATVRGWMRRESTQRFVEQAAANAVGTLTALLISMGFARGAGLIASLTLVQFVIGAAVVVVVSAIAWTAVSFWRWDPTEEEIERRLEILRMKAEVRGIARRESDRRPREASGEEE